MTESGSEIWRLATALSGAVTPVDVAVALAEEGASAAGAAFSNMAVVDDGRVWVIHGERLSADVAERWSNLHEVEPTPLYDAIVTGEAVMLDSIRSIAGRYPHLVTDTVEAGSQATASLPLVTAQGNAAGAAGFAWNDDQPFDAEQLRQLDLIAQMAASALERAVLHQRHLQTQREREVEEAQLLQDIFLPGTLPHVEGLEIAAVYLPALDAAMGGDWYDVFAVDGGTCFAIGDVAGHGLEAASMMVQLRNAVRAYAVEHPSPAEVMGRLNQMICHLEPSATASAIVVMWDPVGGVIIRSNAGHPPILRCRVDEAAFLDLAVAGALLGVDPSWGYRSEAKKLRSGTTLLFYTDGLIELRDKDLDEGMEALRSFVETVGDLAPRALCEAVIDWRFGYGRREDDICVLAVRLA